MSLFRWLLAPIAPLYGLAVHARNIAFDSNPQRAERVTLPVVSIGNLCVGGTGKTPLTLHLAQTLSKLGYPNVIISRGYGGRRAVDPMDANPDSNSLEVGDEPAMMAKRLGNNRVIVGRQRSAAAMRAASRVPKPKLLILDDGFQHRALHRDIDILLLDGVRMWGNGKLLPMGNLREPMTSAKRAHTLVVTRGSRAKKEEIETWWSKYGSGGPIFYIDFQIQALRNAATGEHSIALPDKVLKQKPGIGVDVAVPTKLRNLFAFCALGHPQAFYADLLVAGMTWIDTKSFRDHHRITPTQIEKIAFQAINLGAEGLVCTEKDAVKFTSAHIRASSLPIWIAEQEVLNAEKLVEWLIGQLEVTKV